ncbi:ADP-heptose--lipooligosaccharide heptosyltransferase II [hydrothermal vent metagenome]|uniref:lipopolysaccharide heptosyltransferase II n=1 Tax=hydrothermal vent metagenome TaxID=652676 RepID=A0A3B1E736_9ZZZZ
MQKDLPKIDLENVDAERICIIKPSALGDIVQTLPLLSVLHERFPRAQVDWVVSSQLANILEDHPLLHRLHLYNRKGGAKESFNLLRQLRKERFDLVFDLQGLLRSAVMTLATGASKRIGLETAREGSRFACHQIIEKTSRDIPAYARYWRVAEALGMAHLQPNTIVPVREEETFWATRQLSTLSTPCMAIHAGAQWKTKRLPVEKFAAVASRLSREQDYSILIIGGPSETEITSKLETLIKKMSPSARVLNLSGQTTLKQLAALLSQVTFLLSNDSGPMHLAAGLGKPVVGVFTCTSPHRSGPAGSGHELIASQLPCAASYKKNCPHAGSQQMACLEEIQTEQVWQAVMRLIEREQKREFAA